MSNLIGIDFFRLVSDSSIDDWAQVYARVPFDEQEVEKKGALFGAVRLKGGEELVSRGTEIFSWLDEHFNKIEKGGDLRLLMEELEKKDEGLEAVWLWVSLEEGKRVMRVMGVGDGRVDILREGNRVELITKDRLGQVIKGELREGDRLMMGVGGVVDLKKEMIGEEEKLEKVTEELKSKIDESINGAMAGLLLEVGGMKKEKGEEVLEVRKEEEKEEEKKIEEEVGEEVEVGGVVEKAGVKIEEEGKTKKRGSWRGRNVGVKVKQKGGNEKKFLYLGGVFLVLFLISVGVGTVKIRQKKEEEVWLAVVEPWEKKEEEALALVEVNPVGARELLKGVMKEIGEKDGSYVDSRYEDDFEELKIRLEESWQKVSGESEVKTTVLTSLELLRSGLKGERLVRLDDEKILVLDGNSGVVVEVVLEDKGMDVVLGKGEDKGWKDVAGDEDTIVVLGKDGLGYEIGGSEGELEFDGSVLGAVGVEMFASSAYVLDGEAEEIWKFAVSGSELEERRRWLVAGEELGLSGVVDMDIDGDIWVLSSGGEVGRFRRGYEEVYALNGGPEDVSGDAISVSLEGDKLVILDKKNSRIVEFNKETGEYVQQLVGEKIGKMDDVMITSDDQLLGLGEGELFYLE